MNERSKSPDEHRAARTRDPRAGRVAAMLAAVLAAGFALTAAAQDAGTPAPQFAVDDTAAARAEEFRTLDEEVQELKKLAVDLNRDLFLLEEELLFPASTQVSVFVSMDVGEFFALDSIELELDGKDVASYLYTDREVDALYRGGVQRLFAGNMRAGEHELVAFFTGKGPHERAYRRGATLTFEKGIGPKYIELKISDRESRLQPEFVVVEWE
ncbi:MAG TPA: AraC family transcriptional regulator [Gammaproteobacteria bacterium]